MRADDRARRLERQRAAEAREAARRAGHAEFENGVHHIEDALPSLPLNLWRSVATFTKQEMAEHVATIFDGRYDPATGVRLVVQHHGATVYLLRRK
ncbi:MAG: hypothetical protein ACLPUG_13715 [Acidimicrobiales bacterium]